MQTPSYIILKKEVGETPLEVLEKWRATNPHVANLPLAYAGRLDPMASGKLLVLIGNECKNQTAYHHLDKTYEVEILFGTHSDSGDVLGIISEFPSPNLTENNLKETLTTFVGDIHFPYPVFSAKTVGGKPLHTWAMEGRLDEITIPSRTSTIYAVTLDSLSIKSRSEVAKLALEKIETIPPVTDTRKALGNDFRRPEVRTAWKKFSETGSPDDDFYIARITCTCSSGTYMRTLAELIAEKLGTKGLAFSIHRTEIGNYDQIEKTWSRRF
jgi:tRNA pseudouridine(55) synthase